MALVSSRLRVVALHHGHADRHVAAFVAADVAEAFLEDGSLGVAAIWWKMVAAAISPIRKD
jgi:hypothetical protein